ncbi:MAG: phosphoribosylformylglycinamidine cyclo-ligase [Pseudomonadota bacterium]|nr:phosphoribosylformylglycinamidine cyclo-ligase [Pseudomonadota bacterium]QKK06327.1 MAG: phosphoribosylformylglycinamidine cyclo-ligase [Pseudomonadota bacterium]
MSVLSYKDAGVDIEKGDALVEKIKARVSGTYGENVISGVGGFACLYRIAENKLLAAGTDGVGTKLKIAQILNKHDTIGIDLVAMCVNDILCTGALPLFFMDYLATGQLDTGVADDIIAGIIEGCTQSGAALIGGETAEMPGMYQNGEYDLAGFAVGEVAADRVIDGSKITAGDTLIGLPSSGFHSNGYSLIRKLVDMNDKSLLELCLTPTRIYKNAAAAILAEDGLTNGMAHITGGGLLNIARMNTGFDYHITAMPQEGERPAVFDAVLKTSGIETGELYRSFNMGIGFVIATSLPEKALAVLTAAGEAPRIIGTIGNGTGKVLLNGKVI